MTATVVLAAVCVFLASSYWARILARDFSNTENRDDLEIRRAIDDARLALEKAAARGAECFSTKTPRYAAAGTNLASPGEGVAHGADMVANLLNRLYPPAANKQKSQ